MQETLHGKGIVMQDIMGVRDIAFPHLGIYLENVPKSFQIFGIEIAFYGVIIAIAVLAGLMMALREARVSGQNTDAYWDFAIYAIIFSILGARIYYVVFTWNWDWYKDNPLNILNTRQGGLAIYGAVIAAFLTLFIYTRIKKLSFFQMGDTAVPGLILGQIIGRWGNFMNREAFGEYTDGLFAMQLPVSAVRANEITQKMWDHVVTVNGVEYIQVHPTFLYESLWNVGVLLFLFWFRKRKKFNGEVFLMYLIGYGLGRIWIEGLRTDQLLLPVVGLPVSQLLSGCLVVGCTILVVWKRKKISSGGETAHS